jgi:hypothetical protein
MNRFVAAAMVGAAVLSGCTTIPPAAGPGLPNHPGFDTGLFPGDETLAAWKKAAPYEWVGYYLSAPCHRDATWVGRRAELERAGWGMAILYVGQQAFENDSTPPDPTAPILCSRTLLTTQRGQEDAADASLKTRADGFARGSVVFLDVEQMRQIPPEMATYYTAWIDELLREGRFIPGTYAHRDNAAELYALAQAAFQRAGRSDSPPFWVASADSFSLDLPPHASGFPFAVVWQGAHDVERSWGGQTLHIDENVSTRRSPSEPARP